MESLVQKHLARAIDLRHHLHQIPELMFEEHQTAAAIRAELDDLAIPYISGVPDAPTATIALLGDPTKPCVALRGDIDALPIEEKTNLPYASRHAGKMHACGHDGHTATLLGTAATLKIDGQRFARLRKIDLATRRRGRRSQRRRRPIALVNAGVLDGRLGPTVDAIFGLHGWPGLKLGTVATKPGVLLAATDSFCATFVGRGCHGAYPHLGRDPIVTACEAVLNLPQFVSRELDPTDSAIITVGVFHAGTATNVIPDEATIEGTARTLTPENRKRIAIAVERRCDGIAAANDCQLRFQWRQGYPATVNDPAMTDLVVAAAKAVVGPQRYFPVPKPSMGGEDFAYYLEKVPGCFFLLGVDPPGSEGCPSLHSDRYDFTDDAIGVGIQMFIELVRRVPRP